MSSARCPSASRWKRGIDDEHLWQHRTEPIAITINVTNILDETGAAWREYDEAEADIERRRQALGLPTIDWPPDAPDAAQRLAALPEPTAEQEAADDRLLALLDDLDAQRRREWSAYGQALKAAIEQRVAAIEGLDAPVSVTVELEPRADDPWLKAAYAVSLEAQLINAAILDTPTPVDLPGTPLSRLAQNDTGALS